MRYEVVQAPDGWVVLDFGVEIGRHARQSSALNDVADRMRDTTSEDEGALIAPRRQSNAR